MHVTNMPRRQTSVNLWIFRKVEFALSRSAKVYPGILWNREFQRLVDGAAEVAAMGSRESRAKQNQYLMQVIPFLGADRWRLIGRQLVHSVPSFLSLHHQCVG